MVEALRSVEVCVFRVVFCFREGIAGTTLFFYFSSYFDISSFSEISSLFIIFRIGQVELTCVEEGATVGILGFGKGGGDHGGLVWCLCLTFLC